MTLTQVKTRARKLRIAIDVINIDGNIASKHTLAEIRRLEATQAHMRKELRKLQRILLDAQRAGQI